MINWLCAPCLGSNAYFSVAEVHLETNMHTVAFHPTQLGYPVQLFIDIKVA
jgi:hypothetical protein